MKIFYEVNLYADTMPFYHEGLRYCGRFSGNEKQMSLQQAEDFAEKSLHKYPWLKGGYAHIYKVKYLGFYEGYKKTLAKEIEFPIT